MSMYTQLLDAAFGQRAPVLARPTERGALATARHCRRQLVRAASPATDPDAAPVVLAREIGYDVALLELAGIMGIETDPSRFEQPLRERARLEQVLLERGIALQLSPESENAAPPRA
ncbi:MAG TPA: hypothetical protein VHX67_08925 [Acidimicrobiales bacterium]|jgi:hypothetical protein|nr:hypothetical protein [Acidimicrobiales bacterium]